MEDSLDIFMSAKITVGDITSLIQSAIHSTIKDIISITEYELKNILESSDDFYDPIVRDFMDNRYPTHLRDSYTNISIEDRGDSGLVAKIDNDSPAFNILWYGHKNAYIKAKDGGMLKFYWSNRKRWVLKESVRSNIHPETPYHEAFHGFLYSSCQEALDRTEKQLMDIEFRVEEILGIVTIALEEGDVGVLIDELDRYAYLLNEDDEDYLISVYDRYISGEFIKLASKEAESVGRETILKEHKKKAKTSIWSGTAKELTRKIELERGIRRDISKKRSKLEFHRKQVEKFVKRK